MSAPRPRSVDLPALAEQARAGRPRAVARLISLIEDGHPALPDVMRALAPYAGAAHVVGLTGAPGVGKSTTTNALVREFRRCGKVVGVLAVDPSSPFSGGALLGDRIRMEEHATDSGVFLRSMASRGHLGGLSAAVPQAIRVLEAAGCDVVLIETVGVGQSEVEIAGLADTSIVLLAPGMGDGIQAAKAGILEIADVFVVNKADRDGADQTVRDVRHLIQMGEAAAGGGWRRPVVRSVALTGEGLPELVTAVTEHHDWLAEHGHLEERRRRRAREEIIGLALARTRRQLESPGGSAAGGLTDGGLERWVSSVLAGDTDPHTAAEALTPGL